MYLEPWDQLPNFRAHDWVPYGGETTLADLACSLVAAADIRDGDVLVGSSLGGMVAGEMAKLRRIPRLYLLGSAIHPTEINRLLAALRPLAQVAPLDWVRLSSGKIPTDLTQMFAHADPVFVRAMVAAIFDWPGTGPISSRILRLHGRFDLVIPPPPAADLLLNAGHLPSMTRAAECVTFITATEAAAAAPGDAP